MHAITKERAEGFAPAGSPLRKNVEASLGREGASSPEEGAKPLNAFTVDLEDWYCSRALAGAVKRSGWHECESRVRIGTERLLAMLGERGISATFFTLGYVAEREPGLIREIVAEGHEIASHGYHHHHLSELTPNDFRRDLDRAIGVTEDVSGQPLLGYRAPHFSVTLATANWALDIVAEKGFLYDASIFPVGGHPEYGYPGAPMTFYQHTNGLIEVPASCAEIGGRRIPATGGGYFRHLPYAVSRALLRRCNAQGRSIIFYVHPWELDEGQPRLAIAPLQYLRHYRGLGRMQRKIERLVEEFRFTTVERLVAGSGMIDQLSGSPSGTTRGRRRSSSGGSIGA